MHPHHTSGNYLFFFPTHTFYYPFFQFLPPPPPLPSFYWHGSCFKAIPAYSYPTFLLTVSPCFFVPVFFSLSLSFVRSFVCAVLYFDSFYFPDGFLVFSFFFLSLLFFFYQFSFLYSTLLFFFFTFLFYLFSIIFLSFPFLDYPILSYSFPVLHFFCSLLLSIATVEASAVNFHFQTREKKKRL